ncbi:DSPTP1B [Symbiodinium natans]|uniref:protein-tyrosine-phosphatase n=1 Tax=Symbiodinium natans TaxID=878477 RepID=A0A812QE07_9DINO|nr:DSPTP1B [Symbiodinium natans]
MAFIGFRCLKINSWKVEQVKRLMLRDNQYYKAVNRELKKRLRSLLEQLWEVDLCVVDDHLTRDRSAKQTRGPALQDRFASSNGSPEPSELPDGLVVQTPELTDLARRRAKFMPCRICEERVTSLLASFRQEIEHLAVTSSCRSLQVCLLACDMRCGRQADVNVSSAHIRKLYSVDPDWAEKLPEGIGSSRRLCDMQDLSALLHAQRLDVDLHKDGSASLNKAVVGQTVFFTEVLRREHFHYKSYIVQQACQEAFDDIEVVTDAVARAYEGAKRSHAPDSHLLMMMNRAGRAACSQTRACVEEKKLRLKLANAGKPAKPVSSRKQARSSSETCPQMERRVDPADGVAYTFQDLSNYYAKQYSKQDIQHYWNKQCKPLGSSKASAAADASLLDPLPDLERLSQAKAPWPLVLWDAAGSQTGQVCIAIAATLSEFKAQCAQMLKVRLVHCPDFNDDMDSQQLRELGIGLSDVPVLLELGPPVDPSEACEPAASAKAVGMSTRKVRAPLAVRQAVADASDIREGWLFLGGQLAASSLEGLQQLGITHIMNCCERVPCKFRSRITYKVVAVMDTKSSDIREFIPEALAFIDEVVANGGKILVHCMVGASRSVALVLAWLVARCRMPLKQAFQEVRAKRHQARPNRSFCEQLMQFEKVIATWVCCSAAVLRFARMLRGPIAKSGGSFTPIYESSSSGKNFASVNAGNPKKLKVGGGTINGQFAQELQRVAGHDPDSYSPAHEALLRTATQTGTARHGLFPAPATLRLPQCLEASFIYLGRTPVEAEQIAGDSGRGGLVILDIFETKSRPYHVQNVAMVYTVGPQRGYEPDDATFLSKVRLVGRNVVAACHDYNLQRPSQVPPIDQVRLCLVSGGKFAERVPKELVARQLVLGVLDVQLAEGINPDAMPEIEFAYDGDVFRKEWDALAERT